MLTEGRVEWSLVSMEAVSPQGERDCKLDAVLPLDTRYQLDDVLSPERQVLNCGQTPLLMTLPDERCEGGLTKDV